MALKFMKPAEVKEGLHGILYGPEKTGKTSTAIDPVFKVLLIDTGEGGSAVLEGAENVTVVPVSTFEEFWEVYESVKRGYFVDEEGNEIPANFDLYMIDSLTRYSDLVKDYIVRKYAPNRKREIKDKFGAQSDWGDWKEFIIKSFKAWHSLTKRGDNSVHVLWIAHMTKEVDDITGQAVRTKISLQGQGTAEQVMAIVDAIFYSFKKEEEGKIRYGIATKPMGIISADYRIPKNKQVDLPSVIYDPAWSEIFEKLGYVRGRVS